MRKLSFASFVVLALAPVAGHFVTHVSMAFAAAPPAASSKGGTFTFGAADAADGGAAVAGSAVIPPPPAVSDAMLEPVAPADRNISTWEDALAYLKSRSIDLKNAYLEVKRAEGLTRSALANALTTVNVNGIATHQLLVNKVTAAATATAVPTGGTQIPPTVSTTLPQQDSAQGNIQLSQPILAVATWQAIGTARVQEDVSRLSVEDIKRTITTSVANSVISVITSERVAELNRIGLRSALERLDLTLRRQRLGTVTALDVARAREDVDSARATLVTGDESLRQAREALGLALGEPRAIGVSRDVNLDGIARAAGRVCKPIDDVDARADIQVLKKNAVVAERNIDNVWLQFLPTVNLNSTLSTTSVNQGAFPQTLWNIQGVLQVPLWEGGNRYGLLRQYRAQAEEAQNNVESKRRQATIDITQARRSVEVATTALKIAEEARKDADEVDKLTRVSFVEGRGTSLELVAAAASLRQAEVTLAERELDLVKARVLAVLTLSECTW